MDAEYHYSRRSPEVQARVTRWGEPRGALGQILAGTRCRIQALRLRSGELQKGAADARPTPSLRTALRSDSVAVIAELKRRSPSKGDINVGLSAAERTLAYAAGGAAAISVLTEPTHFGGSTEDLAAVRRAVALPILRKDFHLDPVQLLEAKVAGASAVLLIVRALAPADLRKMMDAANALALEALVEVHTDEELRRAVDSGARLIGVNNRDLETLDIDPATCEWLLPLVPADVIAVAESGVRSATDIARLASFGADAALVGSSLSSAVDAEAAVRELVSIPRVSR